MTQFIQRQADETAVAALVAAGFKRPLAVALASRGIASAGDMAPDWKRLLPPESLEGAAQAACRMADAIEAQEKIVIVADYDCDGATACALAVRALKSFGCENVEYVVPERLTEGYGLSREIVENLLKIKPGLLVTVDNGIQSFDGIACARENGIDVIVTDHHLAGEALPEGCIIVNPNAPGSAFASKALCGVGVIFYVMLALRQELRARGVFTPEHQPRLDTLVDLVALGTVADVVSLDANNRLLVDFGLKRIQSGRTHPGIAALFEVAGRPLAHASARELAFSIAPRINAAGRLNLMNVGIECLITDNPEFAFEKARELEAFNNERRQIESDMQFDANAILNATDTTARASLVLFSERWHQGVVGLIASRIKDARYKPTIAFAPAEGDELRGSGRSIPGVHLRDLLEKLDADFPNLIIKYGGHSMACGLSVARDRLEAFSQAFEATVRKYCQADSFEKRIVVDAPIQADEITRELVEDIRSINWGQGFEEPLFANEFKVVSQTLLRSGHMKLRLQLDGRFFPAIFFRHDTQLPLYAKLAYRPEINRFMGRNELQLVIEGIESPAPAPGGEKLRDAP